MLALLAGTDQDVVGDRVEPQLSSCGFSGLDVTAAKCVELLEPKVLISDFDH